MELPTLNSKELTDYGNATPLLPWGEGTYQGKMVGLRYHEGFKGKAFFADFVPETTTREDVFTGQRYSIYFPISSDGVKQQINMKKLRACLAACAGEDPGNEDFDADSMRELVIAESSAGECSYPLRVQTRNKETKQGKTVTEMRFYPVR